MGLSSALFLNIVLRHLDTVARKLFECARLSATLVSDAEATATALQQMTCTLSDHGTQQGLPFQVHI